MGNRQTGTKTSSAGTASKLCVEKFSAPGSARQRPGCAEDPPSDHGTYQNDKQRYSFHSFIAVRRSGSMTSAGTSYWIKRIPCHVSRHGRSEVPAKPFVNDCGGLDDLIGPCSVSDVSLFLSFLLFVSAQGSCCGFFGNRARMPVASFLHRRGRGLSSRCCPLA